MPVSSKKKRITPASDASTLEPSPPLLPGQQEFHHYLRTLAQSAVRTVYRSRHARRVRRIHRSGLGRV